MINSVAITGRMTKDCDLRYTGSGKAVGNVTVAVNRPFKTNGEQEADFIQCTVWGKQAENLANFMKKGSLIGISGRIQTRSFDNQEGKRLFVTEVVADNVSFLESKGSQQNNQQSNNHPGMDAYKKSDNEDPFKDKGEPIDISDDMLPF